MRNTRHEIICINQSYEVKCTWVRWQRNRNGHLRSSNYRSCTEVSYSWSRGVGRNVRGYMNTIRIPIWLEGSNGDWRAWVTNSNYRNHFRSAQELDSGAVFAKCVRRTPVLWDVKRFFRISNMLRDVGLNRASCTGDCNWGSTQKLSCVGVSWDGQSVGKSAKFLTLTREPLFQGTSQRVDDPWGSVGTLPWAWDQGRSSAKKRLIIMSGEGISRGGRGPNPKPFSEKSHFCLGRVENNPGEGRIRNGWERRFQSQTDIDVNPGSTMCLLTDYVILEDHFIL